MSLLIKVGGSLMREPGVLDAVLGKVSDISSERHIILVAGGGALADEVRRLDSTFKLPAEVSHRMALIALDQNGLVLSSKIKQSHVTSELESIKGKGCGVSVFLPSDFALSEEAISNSWDFTSDSVAAYTAGCIGLSQLILLKDVDGLFSQDPKNHQEARLIRQADASTLSGFESLCIDNKLSEILLRFNLTCFILNGRHPERLAEFSASKKFRGTMILPK
ncbi:MAG: hypothetical protein ABH834_01065 [Candidatus Altiarchaeota archaeon]